MWWVPISILNFVGGFVYWHFFNYQWGWAFQGQLSYFTPFIFLFLWNSYSLFHLLNVFLLICFFSYNNNKIFLRHIYFKVLFSNLTFDFVLHYLFRQNIKFYEIRLIYLSFVSYCGICVHTHIYLYGYMYAYKYDF